MAIEKIELYQNTTVMHDEFLGHRLGLIPIRADPALFDFRFLDDQPETERNAILFELNVTNPPTAKENKCVYSGDLRWKPLGDQASTFKVLDPIGPVETDILIAKLAPSQQIEATLHAQKGIGKDHAKYSPVAACFYRHLTTIEIAQALTQDEVTALKTCFPKGHLRFTGEDGDEQVEVTNSRLEVCGSELTFKSCPSLENKIAITTHDDILSCK